MNQEEFEKIKKEELDYKDERLNKIYRITEEDSYEDYERCFYWCIFVLIDLNDLWHIPKTCRILFLC